ncbi:serine/threonine-protein kinase RsbW [Maridesulfovibrio ferrireducens]|uniref:Serine/threonine-protein kinase RsbW n=1 Tax=Maridesulfovibrio ferrireducens TaxID=246191 RepID=A0A1G9EVY3_9BACT|nr:ATP-binding protein [Maridesulfovibrio ferrireducens]SDK80208.1 serine/threonine-protein kinase RsbW [Maridesulfovibrio ferrireducens]
MNSEFHITERFGSDLKNLSISAAMVKRCKKELSLPEEIAQKIDLAISEAVSNAIRHAEASKEDGIVLSLKLKGQNLIIRVEDNGPGFDFDNVTEPDLENHPSGGYGIFLIKQVMDKVEYKRVGIINKLTMTKNIAFGESEN